MAEFKIDITRAVIDTAERALDEYKYKGHTIREWADKITSGEYQLVKPGNNCDIPRYIDAEALKKDLTRFYDDEVAARNLIDEQPTADVQLVKHGRWILHTKQIVDVDIKLPTECSECGFEEFSAEKYNFCPECGARMGGASK